MAMFDYKNYSTQDAAQLVDEAHRLSAYTNASNFYGLPGDDLLNLAGNLSGDLLASKPNVGIPEGWRELKPSDLGVSEDLVDRSGYFRIDSFYTGKAVEGPQAKIFAQYDDQGNVTKVNLNFSGTNGIADILDYLNLNTREGVELLEPILNIVKDFTVANGLKGSDVLVSGYSLGAGLTNVMAEDRAKLSDGFFTDSDYMGFEVPKIYNNSDVVLNFGYENDVVHRIAGDAETLLGAVAQGKPGFVNPDREFESSTDNVVLFNDIYASPVWNLSLFSLLNIPVGWNAHINGVTTDAITRIKDSTFYEYTDKDSVVIVSELSAISRGTTWVKDKATHTSDHFGDSAFIIGTQFNDLIAGGSNSDYIDAGAGNDTIRVGKGVDHIDGGAGQDELRLEGRSSDWDAYRMDDGTLFFVDKKGNNLVEADNIESVSFQSELISHLHNYTITDHGLVDNQPGLNWFFNRDVSFGKATEGSAGNDSLSGNIVFGRGGDDSINGTSKGDVLHGGSGNDSLQGWAGNDRLFGGEGDDRLDGGKGNDQLFGGLGNDTFVFGKQSGHDVILDFNNDVGYKDIISFEKGLFKDAQDLAAHSSQKGDNVVIHISRSDSITIEHAMLDDVLSSAVLG